MKSLLCACVLLLFSNHLFAQAARPSTDKYPSLLWEITGKGATRPSYLFGTMHVSNKMVFHLSDSFYLGIKNADIVALETNPASWQDDFSRYDLEGESAGFDAGRRYSSSPQDYFTIASLRLSPFEKAMEMALYSNPSILNSFLYRASAEAGSDFEEDTYLDLHIYQAGRKLGKKVCGVEDFHGSMRLVKEAYADAAREKRSTRRYSNDDEFSYARMEEAYRTGNLDLLDTINKVNSQSAAFDEKFLYRRNEIQAASIDSILKSGVNLFAGVGAAHLPGQRGVIEILRRQGYRLRPIKMKDRDRHHKESIERIRVPVKFTKQLAGDGFYSLQVPGKLYGFGSTAAGIDMKQYADMINGSYYMVTRVATNAAIMGLPAGQVQRRLDSVLYENIPGRILSKKQVVKNGYKGYDITNRTRRGDIQRYNIFVTPFEVLIFKMSGNGDYVRQGTEAAQFFSSIQLKERRTDWKKWSPARGGFEADFPHQPVELTAGNKLYAALDPATGTAVEVIRTDIHNYDFVEEDSFDLELMQESFASSTVIDTCFSRKWTNLGGYKALDAGYRYTNGGVAHVRFLVQGPHYYTVVATAQKENRWMNHFIHSFNPRPFIYGEAKKRIDTAMKFTVFSPVALEKEKKLSMYPDEAYGGYDGDKADDTLTDNGTYKSRIVEDEATGEKLYLSLYRHSPYYSKKAGTEKLDSAAFYREWTVRNRKQDTLQNGLVVLDYDLGNRMSSRVIRTREIGRDGMGYKIESQGDTLTEPGTFITSFFNTFQPGDDFSNIDVNKKKSALFFTQFFSSDTLLHKKAVKNLVSVTMDESDFPLLRKSIESLNWAEKNYLEVKKGFISKLASVPTREAADFLFSLYNAAADTLELQNVALETLLRQKTGYAYQLFAGVMQSDPPVLTFEQADVAFRAKPFNNPGWRTADGYADLLPNGSFFDNLTDSLRLTAGIFAGSLLPLINIDDYKQPVMALAGTLVDSNLLRPSAYAAYLPQFLLEAKQLLKKQLIREKNTAIEKKKKDEEKEEGDFFNRDEEDPGNQRLGLYANLLLPFWDREPQVQVLLAQLLQSNDRRLRYNTAMLLLRHNRALPADLLSYFASLDEFRWELYQDLKKMGKTTLFPLAYKNQQDIARSRLMTIPSAGRPDTLSFLQSIPIQQKEYKGLLHIFKYKEKKEEAGWKLAVAGLFPEDSTLLEWPDKMIGKEDLDFTRLTATRLSTDEPEEEQLKKLHRQMLYSRRLSAAQFYEEENRYGSYDHER